VPVYSGDGQIAFFRFSDGLHYYNGRTWKKWKPSEIAGEGSAVAGAPYFDADGRLRLPIGEHDWAWEAAEGRWRQAIRDDAQPHETLTRPILMPVPDGCPIEKPTSIFPDPAGTVWLTSQDGKLYKVAGSRTIPVLAENEPNPFRHGRRISSLLLDNEGGVVFDVDHAASGGGIQYLYLAPKFPLPKATIEITESKGDRARIRFATDAAEGAEIWYSWQLDDGPWQPLQHRPEFLLSNLARGAHRLQLRAYNAELGTSRTPAVLEWTMPLPDLPAAGGGEAKTPPPP
jgi:hypothetical protein